MKKKIKNTVPEDLKCDGSCENHNGKVLSVKVSASWLPRPWYFNYCEEAINIDEQAGFTVEVLK